MNSFTFCPFLKRQMRSFGIHRVPTKKKEVLDFLFYRSTIFHAEGCVIP